MAQLVGQTCVVCRGRIGSVLDSHFCTTCGCPVHAACAVAGKPEGACADCGAPAEEAGRWGEAARQETRRRAESEPPTRVVVLRYVVGVLLFGGFVVFVTPTEMALLVSHAERPGKPGELMCFGCGSAAFFGLPGYVTFPYRRRFQAVAWLSLACMAYSLFLFGIFTLAKAEPLRFPSPETRDWWRGVKIHYDGLALLTVAQFAVWAALFRRRRG